MSEAGWMSEGERVGEQLRGEMMGLRSHGPRRPLWGLWERREDFGSEQRRMWSDLHLKMIVVFVFYCYITNDHKRSGWIQHRHQLRVLQVGSPAWHSWVPCSVSQGWNQGVGWAEFSSEGSGEKAASKFTQVAGRMKFHMVVGLRALFPCWLPARAFSHLLDTAHMLCHMVPSTSQVSSDMSNPFLCLKSLTTSPVSS